VKTWADQAGTRTRIRLAVASEVALAAVTASTVFGMSRLFADGSFLVPLLAIALSGHLLAALVRRREISALPSALIAVAGGFVALTWIQHIHTTFLGLPTHASLTAATTDLTDAWHQFSQVVAPAPVSPGFVAAAAIAIWWVAWFADWAAFRLGTAIEATLPAASLFLFASMLGAPRHRVDATVAFAAAVLAFVLFHTTQRRTTHRTHVGGAADAGSRSLVTTGATLAGLAVLGGLAFGPLVPGARSAPLADWRGDREHPSTRVTVSPLVDIRKRLVDQSDVEVFTVTSTRRAYWRLTSLGSFDGTVWSSGGSFARASGSLPGGDTAPNARTVVQDFQIIGLSAIWLPAAFSPTRITAPGTKVRWDAESSTLIVDSGAATSDESTYQVTSEVPTLSQPQLDRPSGPVPSGIRDRYLQMPASFPGNVRDLARQITRGGTNTYQRARLLQDYFRDNFTYDLGDTPPGHSDQAIEEFLTSRRGYCEQFAGTFAAMARSVGIPARVAVGFTPGDTDPSSPDTYIVRGKHAHAWPEVWIAGAGWVAFEPTPGRGIPGAQSYTGVPEQQAASTPTPVTASTTAPAGVATSAPHRAPVTERPSSSGGRNASGGQGGRPSLPVRALEVVLALVLLVAAWIGGLAARRALRRGQRRRRARTARQRVQVAWVEGAEAVADLGPRLSPAETEREFAQRSRVLVGPAGEPLERLAELASAVQWSAGAVDDASVSEADHLRDDVTAHVRDQLGPRQKARRIVDPRRRGT